MKVGKISESVLKRSVLRMIKNENTNVKNGAGVGSDCAIFACKNGFSAQSVQSGELEKPADIRFVITKAANSVAAGGGKPFMVLLSLLLPRGAEETLLQEIMKEAEKTAKALDVQLAGGHTAVYDGITKPYASVTAAGEALYQEKKEKAKPGQDIVMSKWAALEGTAILAERYADRLAARYPLHMIEAAAEFSQYLSIKEEAALAAEYGATAVHDVSGGGVFAALWELAENADTGLIVDLKKIPVRQETVEVCEFFGISLYELLSGGSLLMTAENGEALVQALNEAHIEAAVIGRLTDNKDRVVINEEEKRFLERPRADEITKILYEEKEA